MITRQEQVSLLPYNTFGMDVKADWLVEYDTPAELREVLQSDLVRRHEHLVVGEGSNLLFLSDFRGVVIRSRYTALSVLREEDGAVYVEAGSGLVWDDLVAQCVERGWYGAENLSLIPGQVGAAAVQNIGAYGVEVKDLIHEVRTVEVGTGEERIFARAECRYGYRESIFKKEERGRRVVVSVVLRLGTRPRYCFGYKHLEEAVRQRGEVSLANVRATIMDMRRSKLPDPRQWGNAGSFFKNPVVDKSRFEALLAEHPDMPHYYVSESEEKLSAAWLIDRSGWKGRSLGAAGVWGKQPLVLVNLGGATGDDIRRLAGQVQQSVRGKFGVELQPEVNYVGGDKAADPT